MRQKRIVKNFFRLKCVSCGTIEEMECKTVTGQPFCDKCFSPMIVISVILNKSVK
jgi:hypothetical protein